MPLPLEQEDVLGRGEFFVVPCCYRAQNCQKFVERSLHAFRCPAKCLLSNTRDAQPSLIPALAVGQVHAYGAGETEGPWG